MSFFIWPNHTTISFVYAYKSRIFKHKAPEMGPWVHNLHPQCKIYHIQVSLFHTCFCHLSKPTDNFMPNLWHLLYSFPAKWWRYEGIQQKIFFSILLHEMYMPILFICRGSTERNLTFCSNNTLLAFIMNSYLLVIM